MVDSGLIELFVSDDIMAEIGEVFRRPLLQRKFSVLTDEFVEHFVTALLARARAIHDVPRKFEYTRDPKDERYINLVFRVRSLVTVYRGSAPDRLWGRLVTCKGVGNPLGHV